MKTAKYVSVLFVMLFVMGMASGAEARVIYVKTAPPARKIVVTPKCPYKGGVWVKGHWTWHHGVYAWVDGTWVKPKKGKVWVDGHWKRTQHGWVWVEGHWIKA